MINFLKRIWANKTKRTVLILLGINILIVFVFSFLALTSSPLFCTNPFCHSMKPVSEGWKKSSHSQIACINCHVESNGLVPFLIHKFSAYKEPFIEITGLYKEGINKESELSEEMPDENCTVCHSKNRKTTPRNFLTFDKEAHEKHEKINLNCARCHNRVGHETDDHENHLKMNWCLEECHSSKAFVRKCTVCHTQEFVKKRGHERSFEIKKEEKEE